MAMSISSRDFELLSTYLDGQLQEVDRQRLEARLDQEDNLRKAYEDLQRMRVVLRSLPRRRAPRNFTLTPQMIGYRPRPLLRFYPALGFASALASLLFVLVVLGDFLGFIPGGTGLQAAQESAPQAMVITNEATQAAGLEMKSAAPVTAETGLPEASTGLAPDEGMRLAPTETQSEFFLLMSPPAEVTPTLEAQPTSTGWETAADTLPSIAGTGLSMETPEMPVEAAASPQPGEAAATKMLGIGGETPTATLTFTPTPMPTETPVPTATQTDTPIPVPTETPQLKAAGGGAEQPLPSSTPETLAMGSENTPAAPPEPAQDAYNSLPQESPSQPASLTRPLLLVQIALLLLAVISGAAFLILRFKQH